MTTRFKIANDTDFAMLRHPHPIALAQSAPSAYPAGEPYRTWNPPMPNYHAVPPAGDPSGYYVPHQFVHPYMRVYPAPSWVGPGRYGRKDATLMEGSANRHPTHPPRQHLMPPTAHAVTPGLAPFVQRVPWNSYDAWTTAPGLLTEDDADLVFGDDSDLFGEDDDWYGEDDEWYGEDDDWYGDGDDDWLGAAADQAEKQIAKANRKFRPFKALSKLFARKQTTGRSQAEEMADQIAQIQRTLGQPQTVTVAPPAPLVAAPSAPAFTWKTAALVGAGSVALLTVGVVVGRKLLA